MEENKITHLGSVFTGPKCQEENLDYILQNLENKFLYKKQPNENSDLIRLLLQRWEWWNCNGERPKVKWSLKFSFYFNHL